MVSLFVGYDVGTGSCSITIPSGRTDGPEHRHTIFDDFSVLGSKRDFDAELIGWRSAAEKDLGASPVLCFRGQVEGTHLGPSRRAAPICASLEQSAQVLCLAQSRSEHKNGHAPIVLDVTPERF